MTNDELILKEYLETEEGNKIIQNSLNNSVYDNYDFIKIVSVTVEGDNFYISAYLYKNLQNPTHSHYFTIPKKILRKFKLNKIDEI